VGAIDRVAKVGSEGAVVRGDRSCLPVLGSVE